MTCPENRHCANCIGTLSLPIKSVVSCHTTSKCRSGYQCGLDATWLASRVISRAQVGEAVRLFHRLGRVRQRPLHPQGPRLRRTPRLPVRRSPARQLRRNRLRMYVRRIVISLCVKLMLLAITYFYFRPYTPWVKKQDTKLLPVTSPSINRFLKFFRWQT